MIDFDKFAEQATRTESVIQAVPMPKHRLMTMLQLAVSAANIMDLVKKEIFYGKKMTMEAFEAQCLDVGGCMADAFEEMEHSDGTCIHDVRMTRLLHGAIGKFTESGEIIECLMKAIDSGELDTVNLGEEMGDDKWYDAIIVQAAGLDLGESMNRVIAKLMKRYPDKFDAVAAVNRDLSAERAILEGGAA